MQLNCKLSSPLPLKERENPFVGLRDLPLQGKLYSLAAARSKGSYGVCKGTPLLTVHRGNSISRYEWRHSVWCEIRATLSSRHSLVLQEKSTSVGGLSEI